MLLAEAVARLITPPESFDARVMMITALLGIVVNVIMGFSLHQGTHKHFHSHIGGGSCSGHDHGDSKLMEEPDLYELIDLKNLRKPRPTRSRPNGHRRRVHRAKRRRKPRPRPHQCRSRSR